MTTAARHLRVCGIALVLLGAVVSAPVVRADPQPDGSAGAGTHVDTTPEGRAAALAAAGSDAYREGRYADSTRAFQAAYAISPRPEWLFAWAQSERKAGRCAEAISLYQRFRHKTSSERNARVAQKGIDACVTQVATATAQGTSGNLDRPRDPSATSPPPAVKPAVAPPPPKAADGGTSALVRRTVAAPPERPSRWWHDGLGDALAATGVAALGASAYLYVQARQRIDQADGSGSVDAFYARRDRAVVLQRWSVATASAGVLLGVAAIWRYARVANREGRGSIVTPAVDGESVGMAWLGRF